MSVNTLLKLSTALHVSVDYLLHGSTQETNYYSSLFSLIETCPKRDLAHLEQTLQQKPREVVLLWPEVVAPAYLKMTRAVKFEDGILHVKVSNSALLSLLHELSERKRLVEALQKKIPEVEIRDISFRIGSFPETLS